MCTQLTNKFVVSHAHCLHLLLLGQFPQAANFALPPFRDLPPRRPRRRALVERRFPLRRAMLYEFEFFPTLHVRLHKTLGATFLSFLHPIDNLSEQTVCGCNNVVCRHLLLSPFQDQLNEFQNQDCAKH